MNLAKAAGVATTAVTGSKAAGSIVKSLIAATSTSSSSEKKSSDDSTPTQSTQTKSEAILRLMYSNPGASAQKAVADGTKEIVDWYAQKNRVSQAEAASYAGKQQTAAMIGGAFSAAGQGLAQLVGKKKGGGEGGGGGGRRSSGGGDEGGGGGCANGRCNVASSDTQQSPSANIAAVKDVNPNQAINNATQPKPIDSSLNQPDQQMAMKSSTDAAVQAQQVQQPEPPPPPEPLVNQGTMQA